MLTDTDLKKIRSKYLSTTPTLHLKFFGKSDLLARLDDGKTKSGLFVRFRYALIVVLLLIIGLTFVSVSRIVFASTPGTFFYPVKQVSESMIKKVQQGKYLPFEIQPGQVVSTPKSENSKIEEVKGDTDEQRQTEESQENNQTEANPSVSGEKEESEKKEAGESESSENPYPTPAESPEDAD